MPFNIKEGYELAAALFSPVAVVLVARWTIKANAKLKRLDSKNRIIDTASSIETGKLPSEEEKNVIAHAFYDYSGRSGADPLCVFYVARDYQNPKNIKYLSKNPRSVVYDTENKKPVERVSSSWVPVTCELLMALLTLSITILFASYLPDFIKESKEMLELDSSASSIIKLLLLWVIVSYPVIFFWPLALIVIRSSMSINSITQKEHWLPRGLSFVKLKLSSLLF